MITNKDCKIVTYPMLVMWIEYNEGANICYMCDKQRNLNAIRISNGGVYNRHKVFKNHGEFYNWITNFNRSDELKKAFVIKYLTFASQFKNKENLITKILLW